ncbi:hypothetical protein BC828DRAFT_403289 [Blastocladiella britannica]|nr:hypothetical protein BC828DRAFT_403289 [Blastocladiella britannica]
MPPPSEPIIARPAPMVARPGSTVSVSSTSRRSRQSPARSPRATGSAQMWQPPASASVSPVHTSIPNSMPPPLPPLPMATVAVVDGLLAGLGQYATALAAENAMLRAKLDVSGGPASASLAAPAVHPAVSQGQQQHDNAVADASPDTSFDVVTAASATESPARNHDQCGAHPLEAPARSTSVTTSTGAVSPGKSLALGLSQLVWRATRPTLAVTDAMSVMMTDDDDPASEAAMAAAAAAAAPVSEADDPAPALPRTPQEVAEILAMAEARLVRLLDEYNQAVQDRAKRSSRWSTPSRPSP